MTHYALRPAPAGAHPELRYVVHDDASATIGHIRHLKKRWRFDSAHAPRTATVTITAPTLHQLRRDLRDHFAAR